MTTTIPPKLVPFVQQELASGQFESESELLIRALEVYCELKTRHAALRAEVEASLAEADRGELAPLDMEEVKAEIARTATLRRNGE